MDSTAFIVIACIAIATQSFLLFLALFEPILPYKISALQPTWSNNREFLRLLQMHIDTPVHTYHRVDVLTNGEVYYEAELAALRAAEQSVNLEAYIFQKGAVARRFVEALTECARRGVRVNLVIDAIGSFATGRSYFKDLLDAGGRVEFYNPIRWYTLSRLNNRTHRELIVVDGRIGFIGGAGFADHWLTGKRKHARWRDTMVRVEGPVVSSLQATFAENWLESSGEILTGPAYFPAWKERGGAPAIVVSSSASAGRSTRARILYQMLLAAAQESIYITSPYFLPDRGVRRELIRAIRERKVDVKILTAGKHTDHLLTRHSSRRLYGDLLKAGAEIYEYQPGMIHTKCMIIDGTWSIVGSTNFDNRSFGLNDEVNLVTFDRPVAAHLCKDFAHDLAQSHAMSYKEWQRRSVRERLHEWLGWILERQE